MKKIAIVTSVIISHLAFAGGMISAEPVELKSVYECSVEDSTLKAANIVKVSLAYETNDADKRISTLIKYDRNNNVVGYSIVDRYYPEHALEIAGLQLFYKAYQWRNLETETGELHVVGGRGYFSEVDQYNETIELTLANCVEL